MFIKKPEEDCRNICPLDWKAGVYYVQKKNIIRAFEFDHENSVSNAFADLHEFLEARKDKNELRVSLLIRNRR